MNKERAKLARLYQGCTDLWYAIRIYICVCICTAYAKHNSSAGTY